MTDLRQSILMQNQEGLSVNETFNQKKFFDMVYIEKWLDTALDTADTFHERPEKVQEYTNSKALRDYAIDRKTLQDCGLMTSQIDSLYRGYYVNVLGFFSIIDNIIRAQANRIDRFAMGPHKSKSSLIQALWKVFAVLMECAFSNNYKFQILTIEEETTKKFVDEINEHLRESAEQREEIHVKKLRIAELEMHLRNS